MIVANHIGQVLGWSITKSYGIDHVYYFNLGDTGVTIFLILSGIVLGNSYIHKPVIYKQFIIKRFNRIYPTYWLALTAAIPIITIRDTLQNTPLTILHTNPHIWVCSFFGFCGLIGRWGGPFLVTGWFIGLIITLYFLFPFLAGYIRFYPHRTLALTFIISTISHLITHPSVISLPNQPETWFPLGRLFEFTFGIYLATLLPTKFWHSLDHLNSYFHQLFKFTSDLSFPLFLIHYPLLFSIKFFQTIFPIYLSISFYLFLALLLSGLIYQINALFEKYRNIAYSLINLHFLPKT